MTAASTYDRSYDRAHNSAYMTDRYRHRREGQEARAPRASTAT
jgi:hypothetical protein